MQYFTLNASYKGIPLKLFFVKQGYGNTNDNWKLIVSTDLKIGFQNEASIKKQLTKYPKEAPFFVYPAKCYVLPFCLPNHLS